MDTHGGLGASIPSTSGTSNDLFLKYVKLILARIQRLERQQQQSKKQSSGGWFGSGNSLRNAMVMEHLFK